MLTAEQYNSLSTEEQSVLQDYAVLFKIDVDMLDMSKLASYKEEVEKLL